MSTLDMSLGDIVQKNSTRGRGGSRGGRGGNASGASSSSQQQSSGPMRKQHQQPPKQHTRTPYQRAPYVPQQQLAYVPQPIAFAQGAGGKWTHDLYSEPAESKQQQQPTPVKKIQGDTIHVSNLASDLLDEDVRRIFEGIGPVKSCVVNFNSSGQSTGTATVTFARFADAEKAVQDYDEAEVDGRVMKLKLVGTVVTAPVVVKKSRPVVQQAVQPQQPMYVQQMPFIQQQPIQFAPSYQQRPQKTSAPRGGAKVARGGRGGGASNGASSSSRGGASAARAPAKKPTTQEDLDAELDGYHSKAAPPAPAAAGQPTTA